MSNLVQYGAFDERSLDDLDKEVRAISSSAYAKIEVGENVFRFLPAPPGGSPFRVTAMHYVKVIPGLDKQLVFACPRVELKQPCICCAKAAEMGRSPNPNEREQSKQLLPKLRVYAVVLDRNNLAAGPQVLSFGKQIWDQLKSIRKSARLGGDFTDPGPQGFDVVILREGTGLQTEYTVAADREHSAACGSDEELAMVLDQMPSLEAEVDPVVPEELLAYWQQSQLRSPAAAQRSGVVGSGMAVRRAPAQGGSVSASKPAQTRAADHTVDAGFDDDFS